MKSRIHGNITRKEGEKKRIGTDNDSNSKRREEIKEGIIAFGVIFTLTTTPPREP